MINSRGFEAVTAHGTGQVGLEDCAQLDFVVRQDAAIVTHNRVDFEDLVRDYFEQERCTMEL